MSFETSQVDVRFVLAVFMFPRFPHLHLHLTFINDCVSVHPALHVCLSSARAHITPLPDERGVGASDAPPVRIQNRQGAISQHGGERDQIFCSPSALEQS